jgi:1-deoxy-D-xylulose-5-phosphate synthase
VVELAADLGLRSTPIRRLGVPDMFVEHADRDELLADLGLNQQGIRQACLELVQARQTLR